VFLPAAASFEKDGTFMNAERRVQRVRRAVPPPEGARTDWEILCGVARALGHPDGFAFRDAEEIWDEIRRVWSAGAGISYARLERGGLQWPCPSEDHPGTRVLHAGRFVGGERAPLTPVGFVPSPEVTTDAYPLLLVTGRALQQFNAGTMTRRTPHAELHPGDALSVCAEDARRLGVEDGAKVRLRSRHGAAVLAARVDDSVRPGELFATFHTAEAFLNRVTGPHRDARTGTPEYKLTAVALGPYPE
jgi:formate dehydrogenase major subunit